MSAKHQTTQWQELRRRVKPRLMARLPHPCPRCGQVMDSSMKLDLGHIMRGPQVDYSEQNVRLEHRRCNRRDGQRITTGKKLSKRNAERMPTW